MIMFISLFSLILGSFFMVSFHRRIMYGSPKNYSSDMLDISIKEILFFIPLVVATFVLGLFPNLLLKVLDDKSNLIFNIIENIN